MPNNNGTLVIQAIRPFSESDEFPVQLQNEIRGGFHSVDTLTDRDNIPEPRLQEGMLVYVKENDMVYQYKEIEDPENPGTFILGWQEAQLGGGGGDLTKELADTYYASINHRHDALYAPLYHSHYWTDLEKDLNGNIPGSSITDLSDVPNFNGHQNKILKVNQDEDGIEYQLLNITLNDLNDGPGNIYQTDNQGNYVNANKMIQIREDGQGWKLISFDPDSLQIDLKSNYGIDPENILTTLHLNQPNGVPQLDANQKISLTQLPTEVVQNTIRVVTSVQELASITDPVEGMQQYVSDEDKTFIYNGTTWLERSVNYSVDVRWNNINGRPTSSVLNIDDAVNKRHEHTNKIILDNTTAAFTEDQRAKLAGIENFAISKATQDSLYKLNNWKPNIFTDINNLVISNSKDGDILAFDPRFNRYINKSLSDVTLIGAIDEALYAHNSELLNGKQDTYFQKNIYKSSTDPRNSVVLYENDMWLNLNNYVLSIWKGQEWVPISGSGSGEEEGITDLNSIIDNNTIINNNGRLEVKEENLYLTKQNITDFSHTHSANDITLDPDTFYLTQQEKDEWNQKIGPEDIDRIITNENRQFVSQIDKDNWNQKIGQTDINKLLTNENRQFVTLQEKEYWGKKQDKNGLLQTNLNQEFLNGQKLDDSEDQQTDILWSSLKLQNMIQIAQSGIIPKEEILDIISSDVGLNPSLGDMYLIINGTDNFEDHNNQIQIFNGTSWDFVDPQLNETRAIQNLNATYIFDGENWVKFTSSSSHSNLTDLLGGQDGKYYHLSEELYNKLQNMSLEINSDDIIEGVNNLFLHSAMERDYLTQIATIGTPQEDIVTTEEKQFVSKIEKDNWNQKIGPDEIDKLITTNNRQFVSQSEKTNWNQKIGPNEIDRLVTTEEKQFVTLSEKENWNSKISPEDIDRIITTEEKQFVSQLEKETWNDKIGPNDIDRLVTTDDKQFVSLQEKETWNDKIGPNDIDRLVTTDDKQFVSWTEKETWNQKQDKDGTLQINLNQELLNGQRLDDSALQSTDIVWTSQKIQNIIQSAQSGIIPKEEVIDIISSDVGLNPSIGDKYLIINGTDGFSGHDNNIQVFNGTDWEFIIPEINETRAIQNLNATYIFNGTDWIKFTSSSSHNNLTDLLGGQDGKYYHLSEELYNKLQNMEIDINSDNIIEGTNNLFIHSIEERNYLTYLVNNGIPQEDVVTNNDRQFVSLQEKENWNQKIGQLDIDRLITNQNRQFVTYQEKQVWNQKIGKNDINKLITNDTRQFVSSQEKDFWNQKIGPDDIDRLITTSDRQFITQHEKDTWNQKIGQEDINKLIINENRQFVTQQEKLNWNKKQDKDGTLQTNLNQELLNGQRLNDDQPQSTNILWSSLKLQNLIQAVQSGIIPKEEVIDIISSDVGLDPEIGDKYLIINGEDGFIDQDNNIQVFNGTEWEFIQPDLYETRAVENLNATYIFDGEAWVKFTSSSSHSSLTDLLGGQDGKYYHLSEELYNKLQSMEIEINSDNVIEGTNNLFIHSLEERDYLTYITNNGIPQEDVVTIESRQFVSQQEKDYWNSGQSSLKTVDETSPLYVIDNKLSIYEQTALQDGYMTKEDKNKLNYLEILSIPPNSVLAWDETTEKFIPQDISDVTGQTKYFTGLLDTPSSYIGSNGKFLMQNESTEKLVFQELRLENISNFPNDITTQDLITINNYKHTHTPQEFSAINDLGINWFGIKNKINTIEENANNYVHPATHSQDMIVTTPDRMFVSQQEKTTWNNKQDKLSYIPENSQNKGVPGGYQSLNADGIVPINQLPISMREIRTVPDIQARDAIEGLYQGLRVFVIDASQDPEVISGNKEYIYDGTQWQQIDYSVNVSMNYSDLNGIPLSSPTEIDEAVSKMHEHESSLVLIEQQVANSHVHNNKQILDQIPLLNNQTNKVLKVNDLGQLYWQTDGIGEIVIDSTDIGDKKVLIYDQETSKFVYGDMVTTWERLDKTSSDITDIQNVPEFTGYKNWFVKVNDTEDGLIYSNVIDGGEW